MIAPVCTAHTPTTTTHVHIHTQARTHTCTLTGNSPGLPPSGCGSPVPTTVPRGGSFEGTDPDCMDTAPYPTASGDPALCSPRWAPPSPSQTVGPGSAENRGQLRGHSDQPSDTSNSALGMCHASCLCQYRFRDPEMESRRARTEASGDTEDISAPDQLPKARNLGIPGTVGSHSALLEPRTQDPCPVQAQH